MSSERNPNSNLGRPLIDWQQAFMHYAALPVEQRSYQAVADHFQVSVRTVERHGRDHDWKQRAAAIDRDAAQAAAAKLVQERAAKLADVDKLIDASLARYANQLRAGDVKVSPADLARLHKLRTDLWNDPAGDPTPPEPNQDNQTEQLDPTDRKLQVLQALQDAGILPTTTGNDAGIVAADDGGSVEEVA